MFFSACIARPNVRLLIAVAILLLAGGSRPLFAQMMADEEVIGCTDMIDEGYEIYKDWERHRLIRIHPNPRNDRLPANVSLDSMTIVRRFDTLRRLSEVPVYLDYRVFRFLEVYLIEKQDKTVGILSRAPLYMPIIEEYLDRAGLPDELKYMAVIESALTPTARSRSGAVGLWQFMHYTGKLYGLKINTFIDERRDPVRSTAAAIRYMKDLYAMFDNWLLAIAAYNCGPGNVRKAIRRAGTSTDFARIYYYLPRETRGYVPAFMAAMYVMNYAGRHGLYPDSVAWTYADVDTIHIDSPLHFSAIAATLPITTAQLQTLNPIYRRDYVPAVPPHHVLTLPHSAIAAFIERKDSVYAYQRRKYYQPQQPVVLASTARAAYAPASGYRVVYYRVKEGDNLGYIADWFDCSVRSIRRWNRLRSHRIRAGQRLKIYVPRRKYQYYAAINAMTFSEKQRLLNVVSRTASPDRKSNCRNCYTVRPGDTLWEIANRYNLSVRELKTMNKLYSNRLYPGQMLKVR